MKEPGTFAVCMHTAKDFGHFAVCIHTAKAPRVASLCSWHVLGVPGGGFAVRAGVWPHGSVWHTAVSRSTAKKTPHGKDPAHGNDAHARQRNCARQRPLPCSLAMRTTMFALPSDPSLCRRCRASTHGKAFAGHKRVFVVRTIEEFSRSATSVDRTQAPPLPTSDRNAWMPLPSPTRAPRSCTPPPSYP
jgi:hypothetical protein